MYFLSILFFAIPLYFSHVLSPWGVTIGEAYSFERQKIYLFLFLLLLANIEGVFRFPGLIGKVLQKYGMMLLVLAVLPFFSTWYFGGSIDADFWLGSHEKHHGYLFYMGCINAILLVLSSSVLHLRKYLLSSIVSALIVAGVALGEYYGGILDIYGRSEMLSSYPGRSSSTLGNPNYVAGFLLPFIPILIEYGNSYWRRHGMRVWQRILHIGSISIIIGGIWTTGSYIALFLLGLLLVWYGLAYFSQAVSQRLRITLFVLIVLAMLLSVYDTIDPLKLLSLQSRWVLFEEILREMIRTPVSFCIGFGPESILSYFSYVRSPLTSAYFPSEMLIDSSHNIFSDILFQYGIFPIVLLIRFFIKKGQACARPIGIAALSLLVFLSLNVVVISHILILILIVALLDQEPSKRT